MTPLYRSRTANELHGTPDRDDRTPFTYIERSTWGQPCGECKAFCFAGGPLWRRGFPSNALCVNCAGNGIAAGEEALRRMEPRCSIAPQWVENAPRADENDPRIGWILFGLTKGLYAFDGVA